MAAKKLYSEEKKKHLNSNKGYHVTFHYLNQRPSGCCIKLHDFCLKYPGISLHRPQIYNSGSQELAVGKLWGLTPQRHLVFHRAQQGWNISMKRIQKPIRSWEWFTVTESLQEHLFWKPLHSFLTISWVLAGFFFFYNWFHIYGLNQNMWRTRG